MSETKELQRFKRHYDLCAAGHRDAILTNRFDDIPYWALKMSALDHEYAHIDRANDEHVETVLEDIEP